MIRLTLDDILIANPHINRKILEDSIAVGLKIKESNIKKKEYELLSPYNRRNIVKTKDARKDSVCGEVRTRRLRKF